MKIDNMREEHQEKRLRIREKLAAQQKADEEERRTGKPYGFISVSVGDGLVRSSKELERTT